jgi:hypothetical protein
MAHAYVYLHMRMYVCMYAHVYVCMYECMLASVCSAVYIHRILYISYVYIFILYLLLIQIHT